MKGSEVKICLLVLFAVAQTTTADDTETGTETGFTTGTEYVTIKDLDVTLECPVRGELTWETDQDHQDVRVINNFPDKQRKLYYCRAAQGPKHFFYVNAKVCNGCMEMHTGLVIFVIFGDVVFTLLVILVVYICAKKKTSPAAPQRDYLPAAHSRQPSAPPPPEPDYQRLNQATRSRDIYAEAGRRAH